MTRVDIGEPVMVTSPLSGGNDLAFLAGFRFVRGRARALLKLDSSAPELLLSAPLEHVRGMPLARIPRRRSA